VAVVPCRANLIANVNLYSCILCTRSNLYDLVAVSAIFLDPVNQALYFFYYSGYISVLVNNSSKKSNELAARSTVLHYILLWTILCTIVTALLNIKAFLIFAPFVKW
jgi:hypothetical protein